MAQASRDQNFVTTLLAASNADGTTPVKVYADPNTHRLLVDTAGGGSGTVTSVSVVTANGFAGTVANATTTPAITLTTTITGILSGNGTAISAASTTGSGAVVLANTPTLITPNIGVATGTSLDVSGVLESGVNGATGGQLKMFGSTSGDVTLKVAAAAGTATVFQLPASNGTSGQFLQTNGSGVTTWASSGGGTPGSPTNSIQYNSAGSFAGSSTLLFNGTDTLTTGAEASSFNINAANATTANTAGGSLTLSSGNGLGTENGGAVTLNGGTAGTTGIGGSISLNGGIGGATSGAGGSISINAGSATAGASNGGSITLAPGLKTGAGTNGTVKLLDPTSGALATLLTSSLTVNRSFTFPDATGTFALTSQLGANITVGTTTITSGTSTRILYDNAGVLGEYTITGSGTVVAMATAPTFVTSITAPLVIGGTGTTGTQLTIQTTSGNGTTDQMLFKGGNNGATTFATLKANSLDLGTSAAFTTGTIELGAASDTTLSRSSAGVLAVEGVVIPSISSTNTLTNKRVTPRTGTVASSATPTINTDNVDFFSITAQTVDITSMTSNLSGTPTDGQKLWIAITGTAARAITWGTSFESSTVTLPTTTVSTNRLDVGFVWNTATSKWRCVATC